MEKKYNKTLIKKLINENPNISNVDIAKFYNKIEGTNYDIENLRKIISKIKNKKINESLVNDIKDFSITCPSMLVNKEIFNDENYKKVNNDKGTLESKIELDYEPKDDKELARLHKIDLNKYKISNYWSKLKSNGKFTSSVFCTERKIGGKLSIDEIKNIMTDIVTSSNITPIKINFSKITNDKNLILFFADEHVGAAGSANLYKNNWNKNEYFKRKSSVINLVKEQFQIYGKFDQITICTLGDNLDGFNGFTTRGGHQLSQNMTNKEAVSTYVEVNKIIWDEIIKLGASNKYKIYNIENSNHGGLGFDGIANLALEVYLKTKYPSIEVTAFEELIGSFTYGVNTFLLTHGKDEKHMKNNLPLNLNPKTETFIKEYMDENDFKNKYVSYHLIKGDLHQFNTQQGKFFTYNNIPSLFGGSEWVSHNFGKSKPGYCYAVVPKDNSMFNMIPVWL